MISVENFKILYLNHLVEVLNKAELNYYYYNV